MTFTTTLRDQFIGNLSFARAAIDTGAPFYQPRADAVAAQQDCDDAIRFIKEQAVTWASFELAIVALAQAAEHADSDDNGAWIRDMLASLTKRVRATLAA